MIIFGLRITAEYHNHYLTMYQKAATQYTSDIDWKLSKKEERNTFLSMLCAYVGIMVKKRLKNKATEYERSTT